MQFLQNRAFTFKMQRTTYENQFGCKDKAHNVFSITRCFKIYTVLKTAGKK